MFKLHVVQAQFGDCLLLQFGTAAKPRFVLIDGGPPDNYAKDLEPALSSIAGKGARVELAVLSHVDNDHVVGLLDLFAALEEDKANGKPPRLKVGALWHNSFQRTLDPNGEITQRLMTLMSMAAMARVAMPLATDAFFGVKEGHRLRTLAAQLGVKINGHFDQPLISVETAGAPVKLGPLTLRIVGPTQANLDQLRKDWLAWLAKTEDQIARDPATAANADQSVPNLSSIVIHAECEGKTLLLTGDARGDHIESGLAAAQLSQNKKLHVDLLKLQHHGSDRNVTAGFFDRVTADTYVISANGMYGNPDEATLGWIVKSAKKAKRKIRILVTNATPTTRALTKKLRPATYGYKLTVKPKSAHAMEVVLAP